MDGAKSAFNTFKKIFIVLGSVLLPIIFVKIIWATIVIYWKLLVSILFASFGGLFFYFYFQAYDTQTIMMKVNSWLNEKEDIKEYLYERFSDTEVAEKSRNFLYIGIALEVIAIYLLVQFILNYGKVPVEVNGNIMI